MVLRYADYFRRKSITPFLCIPETNGEHLRGMVNWFNDHDNRIANRTI